MSEKDLIELIEWRMIGGQVGSDVGENFGFNLIIKSCEAFKTRHQGLPPDLRAPSPSCTNGGRRTLTAAGDRKDKALNERIDELLGQAPPERKQVVEAGEPWADAVLERLRDAYCGIEVGAAAAPRGRRRRAPSPAANGSRTRKS